MTSSAASPPLRFETLYREHVAFVWRTARYLGVPRGEVEDVAQDVFVTVQRKLGEYDGRVSVRSWLYGFVRRVVADHRRRFRRKESKLHAAPDERGLDAFEGATIGPLAAAQSSEALKRLDRILSQLTPEKREAFVLSEIEELSAAEIAEVLQANINTVYTRIRSAREEISALYTQAYGTPEGRA